MLKNIVVTDVGRIFTYTSEQRLNTVYDRSRFGIAFCATGQITYTHKDRTITLDPRYAVLLPKGQTYSLYGDKVGQFVVIDFDCNDELCDTIVPIEMHNSDGFMRDFEKMQYLSGFDDSRAEIMSIFYHILYKLDFQNAPCRAIMPAVRYLESHYCDPAISNAQLARQCCMSEVYFRRIFTAYYKMTPKQFIIDKRIDKAKRLLSAGTLKINAVATQCGFSSQYHFDRVFKEKTGITPSEYMKQNLILKI